MGDGGEEAALVDATQYRGVAEFSAIIAQAVK